ncbi:hypothetical protein ABT336_27405, partial [Micromonospora sp. NPDC000207]|uniref:hypothetical protein n=1 Tax=Micromonospora sp. NPDC000207 TaxID=3154246 RepID=UPI003318F7D8
MGIVRAKVGQVLVDALGRRGLVLEPDPADPTRVKLPLARKRTRWPHSVYAAALDTFPAGKLPKEGERVKLSGYDAPVSIGEFLRTLRQKGVVRAKVGQVLGDALGRHGLVLVPDPADPTRVKLPPARKRTEWPHSVYAAALDTFPAGKLPKEGEKVKLSGHANPVPIGYFLDTLRSVGTLRSEVSQVLVDALRRHFLVLKPDPADPTRVKLPPKGKRINWANSSYAAALDACPEGKLPRDGQSVEVRGCPVPVPLGNFLHNLRHRGVADVDPMLEAALARHGRRLEPHPTRAGKVRLVRDVDGAATHVVAAMAGPRAPGQEGFAG